MRTSWLSPSGASKSHKDHRGVDLISDALRFDRLRYAEPNAITNAIDYAKFYSRSHDAVIRVYDESATVIETHAQAGARKLRYSKNDPKATE